LFHLAVSGYWINSYWGGAVAATGGALVFGALPRIIRSHRVRDTLLLGLGASILANSRPFEGFVFCVPILAVLVVWLLSYRSPSWRISIRQVILPFCAVMLLCGCFIGYYNFRLTGHPTLFPHVLNLRTHLAVPQLAWQKTVAPFHFQNPQFEAYYNHWWPKYAWYMGRPDSVIHLAGSFVLTAWKFMVFFAYPEFLVVALAIPWILRDRRMRLPLTLLLCSFAGFLLVAVFEAHYAAPLTATTFLVIVQGLRHLRQWRFRRYFAGTHLSRAVVISAMLLSTTHVGIAPSSQDYRRRIAEQLTAMPGDDLVIVHYSPDHDPTWEWVYNAADIDHAKIVWAREIPGVPLQPLLDYFPNRRVWIAEPDENPPRLLPYRPSADRSPAEVHTSPSPR
jgi:hypothetical protein